MADPHAQIKTRLKQSGLLPDWTAQGAERLHAAVEIALERDKQRRFIEHFNGNADHLRALAADVRELFQKHPNALDEIARRRHIRNEVPNTGSWGKRSEVLVSAPVGYQGFERSKFADVPQAPPGYVVPMDSERSRFEQLPDPPRLPNGEVDYHALNKLHGHIPYSGPGASTRAR